MGLISAVLFRGRLPPALARLWKCAPLVTKGIERGGRQPDTRLVEAQRSPSAENEAQCVFSGEVISLLELKGNTTAPNAQDHLRMLWTLKTLPSGCWMPHFSTNTNESVHLQDSFSCGDSRLKSRIFLNSPLPPGGLRATRKRNGPWKLQLCQHEAQAPGFSNE